MKNLSIAVLSTLLLLAALTAHTQTLPDYLPTEGLVGWYPFNGNANDESGNGNDGTVNGATLTEDRDGNPSAAYSFDGDDDIALNRNALPHFTISFWTKLRTTSCYSSFIDGYSETFEFTTDCPEESHLSVAVWTPGVQGQPFIIYSTGISLATEQWYYMTLVFESSNSALVYMNGLLVAEFSTATIPNVDGQLYLGRSKSGSDQFLDGLLDDIAIYNRALTPEEITALYTGIPYVAPCADPTACNFEQEGECVYAEPNLDCDGNCLNDADGDGVCDDNEVAGCTYTDACNYVAEATDDDGSCTFPENGFDCEGNCLNDDNQNGVCDSEEIYGCTYPDAINYDESTTVDDGSCLYTCKGDFDNNGLVDTNDLLSFLSAFGYSCSDAGCDDEAACNYDPEALYSDGSCTYPEEFFNCDGNPINDADGDGIPDELEVPGCTDPAATNYDETATDDDGSCIFGIVGDAHTCGAENVHKPELVYGSVTDIDGNTYRTIVIGEQEWMAENLTVEHYANGDPIPNVTDNAQWNGLGTEAWCYYNNDPQFECPYGKLYNWYVTIDARNVCPTGWHVPTDAEWTILTDYLGGEAVAGGKMKSTGTLYWASPNTAATNESGFSGLPYGSRGETGVFGTAFDEDGFFWSSTVNGTNFAEARDLGFDNDNVQSAPRPKRYGFSVRCLKD